MKRKTFLQKLAGAFLVAIPAYALVNCSSSDDGSPGNPYDGGNGNPNPNASADCLTYGTNVSIAGNHGHVLTVSVADINAGVDKTYNIEGTAGHPHEVTVTAANFNSLKTNTQISIVSTTGNSHTHNVTVSCAG